MDIESLTFQDLGLEEQLAPIHINLVSIDKQSGNYVATVDERLRKFCASKLGSPGYESTKSAQSMLRPRSVRW